MSCTAHLLLMVLSFISVGHDILAMPVRQATTAGLAGPWEGAVDVAGTKLRFAVAFTEGFKGLSATIDIQGAKGLPLQAVRREEAKVHFELATGLGLCTFEGTFDGIAIKGTFTQGVASGTFTLARPGSAAAPAPAAALPYRAEDVTFTNGAVTLAGTLTIPEGKGPFPAFVMITGSGAQDRDEDILGFKLFGVIADDFRSGAGPGASEMPGAGVVWRTRHAGPARSQSPGAPRCAREGRQLTRDREGVSGGESPVHQGRDRPGVGVPDAGEEVRARLSR